MKLTLFLVLTFAISFQSNLQDFFRNMADQLVSRVGVLNTGLKFIRNFTLGQGIYPVRVTGYDDAGNETLSMVEYHTSPVIPDIPGIVPLVQKIKQVITSPILR